MPAKTKLPSSGSDEGILRDHVAKPGVLDVMLLWGSQMDDYTQDECIRRLAKLGVEIHPDWIHTLYRLAVRNSDRLTA